MYLGVPRIQSILVRLILVAHKPFIFKNLGLEIVTTLPLLLNAMQSEIKNINTEDLQGLLSILSIITSK